MLTDKVLGHISLRPVPEDAIVGIEIEMEGRHLHIPNSTIWRETTDGSLRSPEGGMAVEYVLRSPCRIDQVQTRLAQLWRLMAQQEAERAPSLRCGVHIHINCQQMTVLQVVNFIVLYAVFENALLRYCGEERTGNLFCMRMQDAEGLVYSLVDTMRSGSLFPIISDAYRYGAINPAALGRYGSLEFRALPTSPDYHRILAWVEMLLALRSEALSIEFPAQILEGLSGNGVRGTLDRIFGEHAEALVYPDLDYEAMQNVRRIQAVAYTPYEEPPPQPKKRRREPLVPTGWETIDGTADPQNPISLTERFARLEAERARRNDARARAAVARAQARQLLNTIRMGEPEPLDPPIFGESDEEEEDLF